MAAGDQRFTRLGVEVLGARIFHTQLTRFVGEAGGKPPGPQTQLTRLGVEVVGTSPRAGQHQTLFTKIGGEALGKARDNAKTQFTRLAIEVAGRSPHAGQNQTLLTRFGGEAVGKAPGPNTRFTRLGVEVAGEGLPIRPQMLFSRLGAEVLGDFPARTFFTRFALEIIYDWQVRMTPHTLPSVLANIFSHNWGAQVKLESAYQTDISYASGTLSEERRGLLDRPYRTLQVRYLGFDRHEVSRLAMTVMRLCHQRFTPVPLTPDLSRVTATSSGTTIYCDTRYRRFFINQRVMIHSWDANRRPANVEYGKILSFDDTSITLQAALSNSFPAGSRVYPCIEAEIALDAADISLVSDEVVDLALTIKEAVGPSALPSTMATYDNPPNFPTYNGRPIFNVPSDWAANVRSGIFRQGDKGISGRAEVIFAAGPRPQFQHEMKLTLLSRDKFWKVLQFFDSRLGRLRSFYMVDPATKFKATSIATTNIRITKAGNIEDLQTFMSHVAVVMRDGTIYIRGVSSVTLDTGEWVLTLDSTLPAITLADVRRVTQAFLVRLRDDAMLEEWTTDQVCSISLMGIEVLDDSDQDISPTSYTPAGPAPQQVPDLYFWASPDRNTWADAGRTTPADPGSEADQVGSAVATWDDARQSPSTIFLSGSSAPGLIVYSDPKKNNGRQTLQWLGAGKFRLRPLGDDFFDNTAGKGLTVFFTYRVGDSAGTWNFLLKKAGVLEISPTQAKLFETLDVVDATLYVNYSTMLGADLSRNVVGCFTWKPSTYAKMYKNGVLMGSAASQVVSLPSEATRELDLYDMQSQFDGNDLLIYKRALTSAELNQVGRFLAGMYDSVWTDIP